MIYNGNYLGTLDPEPWLGHGTATATSAPTTSLWDKISNTINKVADITTSVVPVVNTIRNTAPGGTVTPNQGISTTYGSQQPATVKTGLSTGAKVAIGLGGAALVTGIVYAVTRKKKK